MNKNIDKMPSGVTMPLVKTRAIDDVPMLGLTLWSENYDDYQLKQIADVLTQEIDKVDLVSATHKIGGRNREVRVVLDKEKLAPRGWDFLAVSKMIQASNKQISPGNFFKNDQRFWVSTGNFLEREKDVENLIVGV